MSTVKMPQPPTQTQSDLNYILSEDASIQSELHEAQQRVRAARRRSQESTRQMIEWAVRRELWDVLYISRRKLARLARRS